MRALVLLLLLAASPAAAQPAAAPGPVPAPPVAQAAPSSDQPAKPAYPQTPAPPPPSWQPGRTATIQALDKLDNQSATLTIPAGTTQTWRALAITVRACYARPADQAEDATALLVIADPANPTPLFTGWMLAAEPAASMMQHPIYDIRVLGCR